jgi:hypothetical protein
MQPTISESSSSELRFAPLAPPLPFLRSVAVWLRDELNAWRFEMARYGQKASSKVEKAMHERKHGTLRSGGSGKKVTSRKQAIAIGLSEARREGGKVPRRAGGKKK